MSALVKIPWEEVPLETLDAIIEAFILQEGTDYGATEISLPSRSAQVKRQLQSGEAVIVFHPENESCTVITERAFREAERAASP